MVILFLQAIRRFFPLNAAALVLRRDEQVSATCQLDIIMNDAIFMKCAFDAEKFSFSPSNTTRSPLVDIRATEPISHLMVKR